MSIVPVRRFSHRVMGEQRFPSRRPFQSLPPAFRPAKALARQRLNLHITSSLKPNALRHAGTTFPDMPDRFNLTPTLHNCISIRLTTKRSNLHARPVKPLTHWSHARTTCTAMPDRSNQYSHYANAQQKSFPVKGLNLHVKVTSQAPNPLSHARKTLSDTPGMSNHPSPHSHTQQSTYLTKGFEPCVGCRFPATKI